MDYTKLQFRSANGDGSGRRHAGNNGLKLRDREQSQLQFIVKTLKVNDVIRLKMQGLPGLATHTQGSS